MPLVAHDASSNIRVTIDNLDTQTNGHFKFNFVELGNNVITDVGIGVGVRFGVGYGVV